MQLWNFRKSHEIKNKSLFKLRVAGIQMLCVFSRGKHHAAGVISSRSGSQNIRGYCRRSDNQASVRRIMIRVTPEADWCADATTLYIRVIVYTGARVPAAPGISEYDLWPVVSVSGQNITVEAVVVEQGLTSHQTHYRPYRGRVFTGQMTQPTVSKHWRIIGSQGFGFNHTTSPHRVSIIQHICRMGKWT